MTPAFRGLAANAGLDRQNRRRPNRPAMPRTDLPHPAPPPVRLVLDATQHRAWFDGRALDLGQRAFDLLRALVAAQGQLLATAELMAAAWPGQTLTAGNLRMQVAQLRSQLGPGVVLNVQGRGYRLALPASGQQTQDARQAPPPPPNTPPERWRGALPAWAGPLTGREADLAAAAAMLQHHRLVTVLGAGGIGKTRLAHALALDRRAAHRDGCWWVDLANLTPVAALPDALSPDDIASIARAIADTLALQTPPLNDAAAATAVARALAHRQCLLVLDNAEHLVPALAVVVPALLDLAPQVQLLLTSQQPLQCPDEWVYRLDTLAVPPPGATPAQVRASPAVRLMLQRARALKPRFAIADADAPAAAELARRLDGMALAIELAAAQLPVRGWAAVLSAQPPLPAATRPPTAARHHTLQAALAWSLGLLSDAERQALCTLSVFAGVFTLPTALAQLADDLPDPTERLALVQRLVDASLLQVQMPAPQPAGRPQQPQQPQQPRQLRLLAPTRLHARGLLQASGRLPAVLQRHARTMAQLAEQSMPAFDRDSDTALRQAWLPWQQDWIAAFDHAAAAGDAEAAGPVLQALTELADLTGRFSIVRARGQTALALAQRAARGSRARAWLLNRATQASHAGGSRLRAAQARVAAWRALGDAPGLCQALAFLASCQQHAGDPQGADASLAECDALVQPDWPPRLRFSCGPTTRLEIGATRNDPALMLRDLAMVDELAEAGAWRLSLMHGCDVSLALRLQGQPEAAAGRLRDIVAAVEAMGCEADVAMQSGILGATLAECAERRGLPAAQAQALRDEACQQLERSLQLQAPDDPSALRYYLEPLAWLACRLGAPAVAATLLAAGDRTRRDYQYGCHALNARAGQWVRQHTAQHLPAPALAAAQSAGDQLQGDGLRLAALVWLRSRQAGTRAPAAEHRLPVPHA